MSDPAKVAAARQMLDSQKARLERAIARIEADGADPWSLAQARRMLDRVESWRRDRDAFVTLALGFMGPNGWGPLLDMICDDAEAVPATAQRARSDRKLLPESARPAGGAASAEPDRRHGTMVP